MAYEFDHVHIKSRDPKKTADWYVEAFNFTIYNDIDRPSGDRLVQCRTASGSGVNISNARTGETLGDADPNAHWGIEHFGIRVDDVDAEIERLGGLGAELLEGPLDAPGGLRIAFIKTPVDVRVEIMQFPA